MDVTSKYCVFIAVVYILLRTSLCINEPENCEKSIICTYVKSRDSILITANYSNKIHTISLRDKSSIVYMEIKAANVSEIPNGEITLEIDRGLNITELWRFPRGIEIKRRKIFSYSSRLSIKMKSEEEWTDIVLNYEEFRLDERHENRTSDTGTLKPAMMKQGFYRPNTVTVFHILPMSGHWNKSSVMFTVKSLNINQDAGEYVIIGAGKDVFSGPKAAYLSEPIVKPEKYLVATDEAYVLFLSRVPVEKGGFVINWERSGNRISVPEGKSHDDVTPDSVLQAVPICFFNSSWITEFNQTHEAEGPFPEFRKEFAVFANDYRKEKDIYTTDDIGPNNVQLFRVSSVIFPNENDDDLKDGAIYVMMTVVHKYDKEQAVFRWEQLEEIINRYDIYDKERNHALLGFKVGKCPHGVNYSWWYGSTTILFLFCIVLSIGIWMWTYKSVRGFRRFRTASKTVPKKLSAIHTLDRKRNNNEYIYTNHTFELPAIKLTNVEGSSISLAKSYPDPHYATVLNQSDDDSDTDVYHKGWILKKRSTRSSIPNVMRNVDQVVMTDGGTEVKIVQPRRLWRESKIGADLLKMETKATIEHYKDDLDDLTFDNSCLDKEDTKL